MSAAGSPKRGDGSRKKASVNTDTPLEGRSIASLVKMVTELSAKNPNSLAGKLNAVDDRATGLPAEYVSINVNVFCKFPCQLRIFIQVHFNVVKYL